MNSVSATSGRFPSFHQWSPLGGIATGIFVIDLFIPLGVAVGVLYVAVVLMSLRHRDSQLPLWAAIGCSTLTIIATFLSPLGGELWKVLVNRGLSLFVIWTTTLMVRHQLEQAQTIQVRDKTIQSFLESVPSACFSFDRQGTILSWNPAAEQIYGYSKKEAIGRSSFDLIVTPETQEETKKVLTSVFQGKSFANMIWHDKNKSGVLGWRVGNLFPILDTQGHVSRGINFNIDITTQKETELALQKNNGLLEGIVNSSSDAIYAKDREGKYLLVNETMAKMIGTTPEAIIGLTNVQLFDPETAEIFDQFDQMVFLNGKPIKYEGKLITHGKTHVFASSKTPLNDSSGKTIGLVGVSRDITDLKENQKSLLLTDRVFRASPDHISILGNDYRYRRVNLSYEKAHKKSSPEVVGMSVSELLGEEVFTQSVKPLLDRCFQGEEVNYEAWFRFADDQDHFMAVSYLPLTLGTQDIQEIMVIARDWTDRKKMEEALHASEHQLRTVLDAMTNFVGIGTVDGIVMDCNRAPLELAGLQREDVMGKAFVDTYWINYSPAVQEQVRHIIQRVGQGEMVREDVPIRMGENLFLTVDACYVPVRNAEGQVVQIVHSGIDVSERRQAEKALQKSEDRFRSLVEAAGSIIIGLTPDGWIQEWNREAERLYGKTRKEVLDKNYFELFISEPDRLTIMADIKKVLAGNPTRDFQSPVIGANAKKQEILWNVDRLLDENQQPYGVICIGRDVTAWNQAQAQLQKWATIYQHTQWGVAVGNADSPNLDLVNEAYARMHGYTVEELQGQPIAQVFVPEFRNQLPAFIKKIHEVGFQSIESLHIRKDGTTFPALLTVSAVKDTAGVALYRVANLIDISDLKHTEQALLESQQIYQDLVQTIEGIVWECDFPSFQVTFVSQYAKQLLGYPLQQWHDDPQILGNIIHADERPGILDYCYQTSLKKENHIMEYRVLHANGSILWLRDQVTVIVKDDQPVKLRGIMVDITEQKNIESALKESEQRFRTMFEQAAVGVAQMDSSTCKFIKINQGYCDIVGYSQEEMRAKTFQDITHPDDLPTDLENMKNLVSGELLNFGREKRYIRKDGTTVWVHLTVSPMWQTGETPSHHIAVVQNITERKMMEHIIRQHNEDLEEKVQQRTERIQMLEQRRMQVEKLAALAQIAAGVAHEINNPLASISQSLVLLKRAIPVEHPHFRYMAKTEDCIDRIAQITKNLYQLYRPSGPTLTPIDLRLCIRTATEIMEERAMKHAMRIMIPSIPQPVICQVPQGELIQVLCNLIHNAIDASAPNGTIEMSLTTGPKTLSLAVADHGEGIPPDAASHIFEPFFTTKQNRTEGGMGLGLSISYSLVESMGGMLDFSTTTGHGTTFRITLPIISAKDGGAHDRKGNDSTR